MKYLNLLIILLSLQFVISCDDQEANDLIECDKLTSREGAEDLMRRIHDERILDSIRITENLIGEWGLIGMVPGWVGFEAGQECITLSITTNTIELSDIESGSTSSTDWELLPFEVNGYSGFNLKTNEDVWNNRIGMDVFSDKFMYGSGRVEDGNIYIYEKLD